MDRPVNITLVYNGSHVVNFIKHIGTYKILNNHGGVTKGKEKYTRTEKREGWGEQLVDYNITQKAAAFALPNQN